MISEKSNRILWHLSSFENGRLAEEIVSGRQSLINSLVKGKLENVILHK